MGLRDDIGAAGDAWVGVVGLVRQDADAGGLDEGLGEEGVDVGEGVC